jgi:hypothetical protein
MRRMISLHPVSGLEETFFSQLFTVRGDNDVMQREIHTAEPLVPKPSAFEV